MFVVFILEGQPAWMYHLYLKLSFLENLVSIASGIQCCYIKIWGQLDFFFLFMNVTRPFHLSAPKILYLLSPVTWLEYVSLIILGLSSFLFHCINFFISILCESTVFSIVSVHSRAPFSFHFFNFCYFFLYTFTKFCQLITYLLLFHCIFPTFFHFF